MFIEHRKNPKIQRSFHFFTVILGLISLSVCLIVSTKHLKNTTLWGEERIFELSWKTVCANNTGAPLNATLSIASIPTRDDKISYSQQVISETFSIPPTKYQTDENGNISAVFTIRDLPASQSFEVIQTAKIRTINSTRLIYQDYLTERELLSRTLTNDTYLSLWNLANSICRDEKKDWNRLVKIYDYVRSLPYKLDSHPHAIEDILRGSPIQCEDAARLMTMLAQTLQIPARQITGVYLRPDKTTNAIYHSWSEAKLPGYGWISFDPTQGRFEECRSTRLAQLDSYYIAIWLGDKPHNICSWSGPNDAISRSFSHRLVKRTAISKRYRANFLPSERYMRTLRHQLKRSKKAYPSEVVSTKQIFQSKEEEQKYVAERKNIDTERDSTHFYRCKAEKLLPILWEILNKRAQVAVEKRDILEAIAIAVDSTDWLTTYNLASRALELFPNDPNLMMALAHSQYRLGYILEFKHTLNILSQHYRDGYAEASWGDMCLDNYEIDEAREHWKKALELGLSEEESSYYKELLHTTEQL